MVNIYKKAFQVLFFTDLAVCLPSCVLHSWLLSFLEFDWFYHVQCISFPPVFLSVIFLVWKYGNIDSFYGKYCFVVLLALTPLHVLCFFIDCADLVAFLQTGDLLCLKVDNVSALEIVFNFFLRL